MADGDYASNTINTDTANFGRILGATEDDVQKALDVIDNKAGLHLEKDTMGSRTISSK